MATRSEGFILETNDNSLELWCDADFSGNWKAEDAHVDRTTANQEQDCNQIRWLSTYLGF